MNNRIENMKLNYFQRMQLYLSVYEEGFNFFFRNNPSPWQKFSSKYLLLIAIVITMLVSILLLVLIFLSLGFPEICKSQIGKLLLYLNTS